MAHGELLADLDQESEQRSRRLGRGRHRDGAGLGLGTVLSHNAHARHLLRGDLARHAVLDLELGALVERQR